MKIKQKFSFYFKRNIILRVEGSSFVPKFEMQMRSCGYAATASDDCYRVASFHQFAFMTKYRRVVFIDRDKVLTMLNTNGIAAISAPVGEENSAIGHSCDNGIGLGNNINSKMLIVTIEMIGHITVDRHKKNRKIIIIIRVDEWRAEKIILSLRLKLNTEKAVVIRL